MCGLWCDLTYKSGNIKKKSSWFKASSGNTRRHMSFSPFSPPEASLWFCLMISEATAVLRGENERHYLDKNTVIWVKNESRWGEHDTERDITKKKKKKKKRGGGRGWCNLWRASSALCNHKDVRCSEFNMFGTWQKCQNIRAQYTKTVLLMQRISGSVKY